MSLFSRNWTAAAMAVVLAAPVAGCKDPEGTVGEQPSTVWDVAPPNGGQGTSMRVEVTAASSQLEFGATDVAFGAGIDVTAVTVLDGWTALADIDIADDAELGLRDVVVDIAGREVTLPGSFRVVAESIEVAPPSGRLGETVDVVVNGQNTQWLAGRTWVNFGDGVDVLDVSVISQTELAARVVIRSDAVPGLRDVYTEDGPKVVWGYDAFSVDRVGLAATFDPPLAEQGDTVEFTVYGRDTNFLEGVTTLSFLDQGGENPDIVVDYVSVLDSQNLWGRMTLSNAARLGWRDVLVTTGSEGVLIPDALEVLGGDTALDEVAVSLAFNVVRGVDNTTGDIREGVNASVVFFIPLDPPCPQVSEAISCTDGVDNDGDEYIDCFDNDCERDPACAPASPMPYDSTVLAELRVTGGDPHDCPTVQTVSAGDHVWLESSRNVVTMDKTIDPASGLIAYVGYDLTMADYQTNNIYDLHLEGDPAGLEEEIVPEVQPTVPSDWSWVDPQLWGNTTHNRAEDFWYQWTPAQTYPTAIFFTGLSGLSLVSNQAPASISNFPWDDGEFYFPSDQLLLVNPATATLFAYAYIEGPSFGLKDSIYQSNPTESYIYLSGTIVLE